jgi:hypothetical protein
MVNISTATHFALVSPMVDTLSRDNPHIVASSHQMQLAAEVILAEKPTDMAPRPAQYGCGQGKPRTRHGRLLLIPVGEGRSTVGRR